MAPFFGVKQLNRNIEYKIDGKITHVSGKCVVTGKPVAFDVSTTGFTEYYTHGALVQHAFPELSKSQREFLISGCSEEGFDAIATEPTDVPDEIESEVQPE